MAKVQTSGGAFDGVQSGWDGCQHLKITALFRSWCFEIRDDEVMGWRWIDEFVVSYGLTNEWK